jgi:hypothetical protein
MLPFESVANLGAEPPTGSKKDVLKNRGEKIGVQCKRMEVEH